MAAVLLVWMASLPGAATGAQRPNVVELSRAGWEAINGGRAEDAAAAFAAALKQTPQEPELLVGAAMAAHLLGRGEDARRHLADALRVQPALTPASLLLGEVLYRSGDIDGAIAVYAQALVHTPGQPQLTRRLEAWRKESDLHGRFAQRLGNHFTVLFEGPAEAALADKAVAILENAYWRIGTLLYAYPPDVITVVLYTREQFRDVTQSPDWAGGAFDGRIRVPVRGALQNLRELERVLTHELTHALVRSIAPRGVPVWLDEGLAVNFEGSDLARKEALVAGAERPFPLSALETSFGRLDASQASLAYAQSAVAVKALLDRAGAPAVAGLLAELGSGTSFERAFEKHILLTYAEFQKGLQPVVSSPLLPHLRSLMRNE